jgi:gamma-glutamylcyclotransferase (GGCT)/AIG2-like uncharacterized protein YtfP
MEILLNVFVYGTLKPNQINYNAYCRDHITEQKKVYTFGRLYYLTELGYPAMVEDTKKVKKVYGYLLSFNDLQYIDKLDILEDFQDNRNEKENEYQRRIIKTYTISDNSPERAWTYLMDLTKIHYYQGVIIESGDFNDY